MVSVVYLHATGGQAGFWLRSIGLAGPRGVAMGVFIPTKSAQVNFLWGKNDVRTAIQQFYAQKKTFIPPKNKFLATPLLVQRSTATGAGY